jgi:hypothetical protein
MTGITSYFKIIKALGWLFLIMTIITLPSLIIFSSTKYISSAETAYKEILNPLVQLSYTTISSLHEPIASCREAYDGEIFAFECPEPFHIRSSIGYYGQNWGYCVCPYSNQPNYDSNDEKCVGDILESHYPGQCEVDNNGDSIPCFRGKTRYGVNCCSNYVKKSGDADMDFLELYPNATCNSKTAPYITKHYCNHANKCSFSIGDHRNYSFPLSLLPQDEDTHEYCLTTSDGNCITTFQYNGNFNGCSDSKAKGFIFEAFCSTDEIILTHDNQRYHKEHIMNSVTTLNVFSIIVFLCGIVYINYQQKKEAQENDSSNCTASDYTVKLYTLPHNHHNMDDNSLKKAIRSYFEEKLPLIAIADINFVTNTEQYLYAAVNRGQYAQAIDKIITQIKSRLRRSVFQDDERSVYTKKLKLNLMRFAIANDLCLKLSSESYHNRHAAYVTFEDEHSFRLCMKAYRRNGLFTPCFQSRSLYMDDQV